MKKKLVSILLCACLTASALLSGCGSNGGGEQGASADGGGEGSSDGKYSEFITVDVFDTLANYQGTQSGWFAKAVKDRFNMELNIISPNVAGGGDTLFQTRSAAGNLGDLIISGTDNGRFKDMVAAGLLMDMAGLLKDKDVAKNYGTAIAKANELAGQDGTWGVPSEISVQSPEVSLDGIEPMVAPYVRWDAYKAAGYPEMKSLDDFIPAMKAMQEKVPQSDSGKQTYAISLFKDWDGNMMVGAKNFASLYGYNELGFVLSKADGSDMQDIIDKDGYYVKSLEFLFKANQEGLVDPESTTQNYDILSNKYRDGQVLTSLWSYQGPSLYNTVDNKAAGKGFKPAMIGDMSPFSNGCYSTGNSKTVICIGSQCKDPERMADFIDWLYSSEGMEISGQANGAGGPEGLAWELKDGKAALTEFGQKALHGEKVDVPEEWGGGEWTDGVSALNFKACALVDPDPKTNEPYMASMWSSMLAENNTPLDTDWETYAEGAKTTIEWLENKNALSVAPGASYTPPEESSDITTLRNQCKAVIVDSSWKMVFAKDQAEFDSVLKEMQETVKGLVYEEVLKLDMENAKAEADARAQAVKDFNSSANADAGEKTE